MNRLAAYSIPALVGLALTSTAHAQTKLDFENLPNPDVSVGNSANFHGTSVSQNGFTVVGGSLGSIAPNAPSAANYTGSVALFTSGPGGLTILTQDNGNPFKLDSVDLASLYLQAVLPSTANATFVGTVQGGGTVTQTFTGPADNGLNTFTFGSDFTNLLSVTFNQGTVDPTGATPTTVYQFDNFVLETPAVTATPEPGSVALLLGLGTAGAGLLTRRRKHRRRL